MSKSSKVDKMVRAAGYKGMQARLLTSEICKKYSWNKIGCVWDCYITTGEAEACLGLLPV